MLLPQAHDLVLPAQGLLPKQRPHSRQQDRLHGSRQLGLGHDTQGEARDQRGQLGVEPVLLHEGQQPQQGSRTAEHLASPGVDLVSQHIGMYVQRSMSHQNLHELQRLFQGRLREQLHPQRVLLLLLPVLLLLLLLRRLLLLRLPLLLLGLLLLRRRHLHLRRLVLLQRLVVQSHVRADGVLGRAAEELVAVDPVLDPEELHVGPQGALAQAVGVEVVLVLHEVLEVLHCVVGLPEALTNLLLPLERPAQVALPPRALHVMQVGSLRRVRLRGESQRRGLGLIHLVAAQHGLAGGDVQVSIRQVHVAGGLEGVVGLLQGPGVLQNLPLEHVELHHGRGVGHGLPDVFQRLVRLPNKISVLCGQRPRKQHRDRFLLLLRRARPAPRLLRYIPEGPGLHQLVLVVGQQRPHELHHPAARNEVQWLHQPEEGRHPLAQLGAQVLVQAPAQAGPGQEVQGQAAEGVRPGVVVRQVCEPLRELVLLLLGEGSHGLVGVPTVLTPSLADHHQVPPLRRHRRPLRPPVAVRRQQPPPDPAPVLVQRPVKRYLVSLPVPEPRRWRRGPEPVEALLAGQQAEDVRVLLGVDPHEFLPHGSGLLEAPEVQEEPALDFQEAELVGDPLLLQVHQGQGLGQLPGLLQEHDLVHGHLAGFVSGDGRVVLESLLSRLQNCFCHFVIFVHVLSDGIAHPILPIVGFLHCQLPSRFGESREISAVDLKNCQITENLQIGGVVGQRPCVALHGVGVVPVLSVQQSQDVPAHVALQVLGQTLLHQLVRLLLLVRQAAERQPLHAQCLPMVGILLQNRVSGLDPLLVLLGLVKPYNGAESGLVLGSEVLHGCAAHPPLR
mmetsp:Transcript_56908/g.151939  ORF Transcript_56908/g.151939 Transcript_56908/m.151939 type:complete len:840 (+) Transcript_56908:314-2833(+)